MIYSKNMLMCLSIYKGLFENIYYKNKNPMPLHYGVNLSLTCIVAYLQCTKYHLAQNI